jgi:hypothetical protein
MVDVHDLRLIGCTWWRRQRPHGGGGDPVRPFDGGWHAWVVAEGGPSWGIFSPRQRMMMKKKRLARTVVVISSTGLSCIYRSDTKR